MDEILQRQTAAAATGMSHSLWADVHGDKIAIVGANLPRLYWTMNAAQMLGAVPLPVYADAVAEEMAYVLAHAEASLIVAQDQEQVDKIVSIADRLPHLRHVLYDETREESTTARDRVEQALAGPAGGANCKTAFAVATAGIAARTQVSGYMLSKILPLVVVVMVMLGAFHPAIDITAGERERGTLETTLSAPIDRAALMVI